jgi:hypothetical protein
MFGFDTKLSIFRQRHVCFPLHVIGIETTECHTDINATVVELSAKRRNMLNRFLPDHFTATARSGFK